MNYSLQKKPQLQRSIKLEQNNNTVYWSIDDIIRDGNNTKNQLQQPVDNKSCIKIVTSHIDSPTINQANSNAINEKIPPPQIAKIRPTYMLGAYDLLGKVWDIILQSLIVICVGLLPYAICIVLFPDIIAKLTTSPLNIVFLPLSIIMTTIGAFVTRIMRCELWIKLTTPKPKNRM